MPIEFREKPLEVAIAYSFSIAITIAIAIIMFVYDPSGTIRECYIFLRTKIAEK